MKRMIWPVLVVIVFIASPVWMGEAVVAQTTGPAMQVTVGFDGYCRSGDGGGWCPIYVVLSNEGADVEGELRVIVGGAGTGGAFAPNEYVKPVVLPAHSRKAYFLYIPSLGSRIRSNLLIQLLDGDEALASQQVTVMRMDEASRLYGVASSTPSALNFLSDVAPAGSEAKVAHVDLAALPPDPLGWDGLDVLILNDVDTSVLDGDQRRALEIWLAHGGHLIVGGGAGAARTVAGVADLLPVTVGGARSVDDLWALGEWVGAPTVAGPFAVAEAGLQDGRDGEVLVTQDDLILLARRSHGAGRVDCITFDAGLNPFNRWDDNGQLWQLIVGEKGAGARPLALRNGHSARQAINTVPGLQLPSTLQILGFMLAYTILIGPINYVVLHKLDRRELAWLTIPVLILGFTGCAYLTGFQIRGGTAIVHQLAAVYVQEGAETGRVSQVVGLFSPRRTTYDVWVAEAGVREMPEGYGAEPGRQPLHVVEQADGATLTGVRVDVGGIQPFVAEGYTDVPGVEADLRLGLSETGVLRLQGSIRNGDTPLQGAVLLMGGDEQRLDDLEAGEEVPVDILLHSAGSVLTPKSWSSPTYSYEIIERIMGPGNYWGDRTLYRRYQFLQSIFLYDYGGSGTTASIIDPGVYLAGWVEDDVPLSVEVVDRPFSTVGTTFYFYALPVSELETGATIVIPPSLIARRVEEIKGGVNIWPEGCHMEEGSEVTFRFTVWQGMMVEQVEELVLELQGSSYEGALSPTVSLWNQESGDWERMTLGWGRYSIPNPGAFVLPRGEVLVRLETDDRGWVEVNTLAITIEGQR